jgi:hypothetical protein
VSAVADSDSESGGDGEADEIPSAASSTVSFSSTLGSLAAVMLCALML